MILLLSLITLQILCDICSLKLRNWIQILRLEDHLKYFLYFTVNIA